MKKILIILESICSLGLIGSYLIIIGIHNTISYEKVTILEKIPKSNLFTIMQHHHILGYSTIFFGVILAVLTIIRIYFSLSEKKNR